MVPASSAANDDPAYQAMKQYSFVATEDAQQSLCFKTNVYCGYYDDAVNGSGIINEVIYGYTTAEDALNQAQKQIEDNIAQNVN